MQALISAAVEQALRPMQKQLARLSRDVEDMKGPVEEVELDGMDDEDVHDAAAEQTLNPNGPVLGVRRVRPRLSG